MADIRINALATTATTPASDDYLALDGTAQGTRKILATNIANNVTDVILGTSGPSVKSSLSARAPRQGLVFDGTSAPTVTVPAVGTADFSIAFWVTPNTSVAYGGILSSVNGGVYLTSLTPKILNESSVVVVSANAALTLSKNSNVVYTRSGTTGTWYINGVAAGSGTDSTNYSVAWSYIGSTVVGILGGLNLYNRALSASEVVALYEAGAPAGADYNSATNTNQITGDAWWTTATGSVSSGTLTMTSGQYILRSAVLTKGKRYRTTYNVTALTGTVQVGNTSAFPTVVQNVSLGAGSFEFTANDNGAFGFNAVSGTATITSVTFVPVGLLLAPDAAQAGGGLVWYDTSGNAANITLPASGVSWNVPFGNNIAASGTNQNLTLNASGTGSILLGSNGVARGQFAGVNKNGSTGPASSGTTTNGIWRVSNVSNSLVLDVGLQGNASPYPGYIQVSDYSNLATSYPLALNPNGGNVLIGTTTDGGQKLQVSGNSGFLGHLEIPADKHIYMKQGNPLRWSSDGLSTGTVRADIYADSGGILYFRTNGTTAALNIDNFQTARFAGAIAINNTVQTAAGVSSTHKVTISIGGSTYYLLATNV